MSKTLYHFYAESNTYKVDGVIVADSITDFKTYDSVRSEIRLKKFPINERQSMRLVSLNKLSEGLK